ncbi:MAG: zinc ribbon domain-containing protein [Deltaproteobacteria bacterium]|nr:zinc ribbon domain-containing protein [Deltaproteobacteria bacterium]
MTAETPKSARTIRCESCGSSIELVELATLVSCAHCGHQQTVDPKLLAELAEYRDGVRQRLEQADREQQQAAAWERSTAALKGKNKAIGYIVPIVLCLVVPGGVAAAFSVLVAQGVIAQEKLQYLAYILPVFSILGIGGYYAWYYTRYRRKGSTAPALSAAEVHCPSCGAPNRIGAGEVLESCEHCGAALMPDRSTRQRSVDAAVEAHRLAQMEKYRAERQGYASLRRVGLGPVGTILMVGGPFLLMVGGGSIAFSYSMWVGDDPYSPAIFAMWGLTIALVIGLTIAVSTVKRRQARVRDGVAVLAASLGGRGLDGLAGVVGWLNRFWAGPIDPFEMMPGSCYGAGAIVLSGFPVLVDVNPRAASQQHRKWARILVPCAIPGVAINDDSTAPFNVKASRLIQKLSAVGFEVTTSAAGLLARAGEDIAPELMKSGEIATLAMPITDLVRLADTLGAAPVNEIC